MINYRDVVTAAVLALFSSLPAFGWDFTVRPSNPRVNETVRVDVATSLGCDLLPTRLIQTSMAANRITVLIQVISASGCLGVPPPSPPLDLALSPLPPGAYEVEVLIRRDDNAAFSLGTRSFVVAPRRPQDPIANYTDLWWNPEQSGWGLDIVQHPSNVIFATWFAYDDDGKAAWYVVPGGEWSAADQGRNLANHVFTGPIYRTSGPTGGAVDPGRVTRTLVGSAQFAFLGWDRMTATLTIDGRTTVKNLQRQPF